MINLCLRWDDRVSHEVSSVPWEIAFEPDSLSCSNSVIYGSFLRTDSMWVFFKILNALSIYFQLKHVILKDAGVKTERRKWSADIDRAFPSLLSPFFWKGKPRLNDPYQITWTWFITLGGDINQSSIQKHVWRTRNPTGMQGRGDTVQKALRD